VSEIFRLSDTCRNHVSEEIQQAIVTTKIMQSAVWYKKGVVGRFKSACVQDNIARVCKMILQSPRKSVTQCSQSLGITKVHHMPPYNGIGLHTVLIEVPCCLRLPVVW
jgi:hypothetical protein